MFHLKISLSRRMWFWFLKKPTTFHVVTQTLCPRFPSIPLAHYWFSVVRIRILLILTLTIQHRIFGAPVTAVPIPALVLQIFAVGFLLHTLFTNWSVFFIPSDTTVFKELEIYGKNKNETENNNKHLNLIVSSGAVYKLVPHNHQIWGSHRGTTGKQAVFALVIVGFSTKPVIISSLTNGNRHALLGSFFHPGCLGPSSSRSIQPLAIWAFVWSEASLTPFLAWVRSHIFTSNVISAAHFQHSPLCLQRYNLFLSFSIRLGFTGGRTGASSLPSFLRIAHCPTSSAGIKCREAGESVFS